MLPAASTTGCWRVPLSATLLRRLDRRLSVARDQLDAICVPLERHGGIVGCLHHDAVTDARHRVSANDICLEEHVLIYESIGVHELGDHTNESPLVLVRRRRSLTCGLLHGLRKKLSLGGLQDGVHVAHVAERSLVHEGSDARCEAHSRHVRHSSKRQLVREQVRVYLLALGSACALSVKRHP